MAEHVDDQEARRRSVERMRQQAANGHAPARRLNGHDHAPAAPAAEISWGPVIGQVAADSQREIAALKEQLKQLTDLVAKKSDGISAGDLRELAEGLVPWVREDVVAPLSKRIDEIENVVRSLVEWRARK